MRNLGALLCVATLACLATVTWATLTPSEKKKMLDAHNRYRRQVVPPATDMRLMTWDESVAVLAQDKADKCVYSHGVRVYHPKYGALGENIYITSGRLPNSLYGVDRSVFMWNEEKNYYDYENNTCLPNKECGHYTQLTWATSTIVGCGMKYCPGKVTVGKRVLTGATLVFCEYTPAGNVEVGFIFNLKVGRPYQTGDSCSACPTGANVCVKKLCLTSAEASAATPVGSTAPPSSATSLPPSATSSLSPADRTEFPLPPDTTTASQIPATTQPLEPDTTATDLATTGSVSMSYTTAQVGVTNGTAPTAPSRKCYVCKAVDVKGCLQQAKKVKCAPEEGFCMTATKSNKYELQCATKRACDAKAATGSNKCCSTDYCNKAGTKSGPGGSAAFLTSSLRLTVILGAFAVLSIFR